MKKLNTNIENIALFFMLIFSLIIFGPIIFFTFYLVPNLEDISLSNVDDFQNVFDYVKLYYLTFDGRYSTNFFHYFNPLTFKSTEGYKYLPFLSIFLLVTSVSCFFYSLLKTLKVKFKTFEIILSAIFISASFLSWIYSLPHILYWFGSAMVYLYPIIFFLFFLSFYLQNLISKIKIKQLFFIVLSNLFIFMGVGLSELSLFFFNAIIFSYLAYLLYTKKEIPFILKSNILMLIISTLIFVLAPGIWVRREMFSENFIGLPTYLPYLNFLKHNIMFQASSILPSIFMVLVLNVYWFKRIKIEFLSFKKSIFIYTYIVAIVAFVSLAYYIPSGYYTYFPLRIFNSIWGFYLILIIPLLYTLLDKMMLGIKVMIIVGVLSVIVFHKNKTIQLSLNLLKNKEYRTHHNAFQKRFDCLEYCSDNNIEIVYIKPYKVKNRFLTFPPFLTPNREEEYWNEALENYFDIENILLVGDTIDVNLD